MASVLIESLVVVWSYLNDACSPSVGNASDKMKLGADLQAVRICQLLSCQLS